MTAIRARSLRILALAGFFCLQGPLCAYACLSAASSTLAETSLQSPTEGGAHNAGCHGAPQATPSEGDRPAGDRECNCHLLEGAPPSGSQPVNAPTLFLLPALATTRVASLQ